MTDEEKNARLTERGEAAFQALQDYFEKIGWKMAEPDKENYTIFVPVQGDDLPMQVFFRIRPELEMLHVTSPLPVVFPESRYMEASVAVNAVNGRLAAGMFSLDFRNGRIFFDVSTFYADTGLSEEEILLMVDLSITLIDQYNDKFLALQNNLIDINTFLDKIQKGIF